MGENGNAASTGFQSIPFIVTVQFFPEVARMDTGAGLSPDGQRIIIHSETQGVEVGHFVSLETETMTMGESVCRRVLLLIFGAWALCSSGCAAGKELKLAEDGQARATIVLASEPSSSAQLAAFELQHYIQKMSGARLPIVHEPHEVVGNRVLIGETKATRELGYSNGSFVQTEYLIEVTADTLILTGRDVGDTRSVDYAGDLKEFTRFAQLPLGSCHAVHTFLENVLGLRWYLPSELGEVVPDTKTVRVPAMKLRRKVRVPFRADHNPKAINRKLFYSDFKATGWQHEEYYDLRNGVLYWIRNKQWGGPAFGPNHSFVGWDKAFGREHPEWFSTKSWERMQELDYQYQTNPCLSQTGVFQANLEIIRNYLDNKPAATPGLYWSARGNSFGICLNDNGSYCRCPDCVRQYRPDAGGRGALSKYFWDYINRLARELRQSHSHAELIGLAYSAYTDPPIDTVLESNTGVMICRMPNRYWHSGYKKRDYDDIRRFVNECRAPALYTWEYLIHPFAEGNPFPPVLPRLYAEDARFLTSIEGFQGGYMQISVMGVKKNEKLSGYVWAHPLLDHFRLYFRMKLYDDETRDIDQMLDEYYTRFYGSAGDAVRRFVEALEGRWCDQAVRQASGALPYEYGDATSMVWWEYLGTPEFIKKLQRMMASAKAAATPESVYARRVNLLDKGILQLIINNRKHYAGSDTAKLPPIPEIDVPVLDPVAVDGREEDAQWQSVAWQPITRTNMNKGVTYQSRFKAVAGRDTLYLLVECTEPFTENIVALMTNDGPSVLSDDSVEIFIDEDENAPDGKYWQLGFNTLAKRFVLMIDRSGEGQQAVPLQHEAMAAVSINANKNWVAEIAISWKAIAGSPIVPGTSWRLNVCRNRNTKGSGTLWSNWSVTGGTFHTPSRFGRITFRSSGK